MSSIEIYQIFLPLGESLTVQYGNNIVFSLINRNSPKNFDASSNIGAISETFLQPPPQPIGVTRKCRLRYIVA